MLKPSKILDPFCKCNQSKTCCSIVYIKKTSVVYIITDSNIYNTIHKNNLLKVLDKYQLNETSIFMILKKRVCLFLLLNRWSESRFRRLAQKWNKECAISVDIFLFSKVREVKQTKPFTRHANLLCQLNENHFNEKCQFIL